nr:MAG TPA: Single strand binding protein [Caudoviricetes sp.]
MNVITLIGRLTYEPEIKTTTSGLSVMNFQLAVDRNYQASSQERKADFIDCQAWRQTAEFIHRYFHKGSMIAIEGELQTANYTAKDGSNRKAVTVVANHAFFCGSNSNANNAQNVNTVAPVPSYATADNSDFEEIIDDDDDLPF